MSQFMGKLENLLKNPLVDTIANFIKKFKSSKSYWSVSYLIIFFTLREAIAWKYGDAIRVAMEDFAKDSSFPWLWNFLGFIFEVGGSWELVILGVGLFLVLSLVKATESENTSVSVKENYLTVFLLIVIIGLLVSPKYTSSTNQQVATVNGLNNTIKQEINIDKDTKKLCQDGISNYLETIKELTEELNMAKMSESKKIIGRDLEETEKQLTAFKKECN